MRWSQARRHAHCPHRPFCKRVLCQSSCPPLCNTSIHRVPSLGKQESTAPLTLARSVRFVTGKPWRLFPTVLLVVSPRRPGLPQLLFRTAWQNKNLVEQEAVRQLPLLKSMATTLTSVVTPPSMIINQYYPAGLSRVTNYYHSSAPTYIPSCAPRTAFTKPTPKPVYHYVPPAFTYHHSAYGYGSPVIIINNTISCHDTRPAAPLVPPAPAPAPVHDPPSCTTARRVVGGAAIPGMSPPRPVYSVDASRLETGLPLPSQSLPLRVPSPPNPPPPSTPAAIPRDDSEGPQQPSRSPRVSPSLSVNHSGIRSVAGSPQRNLSASTSASQTFPTALSTRSAGSSTDSGSSDPELTERREEADRNMKRNITLRSAVNPGQSFS